VEPGPPAVDRRAPSAESSLSAWGVLALAAWFGLAGGALDLAMIFIKRDVFHTSLYYEQGKNFRWVVPLANLAVIMVPGIAMALASRFRPGAISARMAAWSLATLAIWGPLLRLPLYGVASLLLAAGAGRAISRFFARADTRLHRFARFSLPVLLVLVGSVAVVSLRRQIGAESQALAGLPARSSGGRNVVFIVLDTVRAQSLALHGYTRNTTPHLSRWAKRGVRFNLAMAPAPWTLPSHCSFMTGQWPSTLGAHWQQTLSPAYPTLAEFLASRGYYTAGFAANTYWCSYESGMDRGFAHYEDYPLTPRSMLGSTMPGRYVLEAFFRAYDSTRIKWIRAQSRDAAEINRSFLDWLPTAEQTGRPFFAFLNFIDAHEPFMPRDEAGEQFGRRPETFRDGQMLLEYWDLDKLKLTKGDIELAQDCYDDCIAALDAQVGVLLDELEKRGKLKDTLVIITADHGEQFGEHGVFNHGFSVYGQETHVPLLIISDGASAGISITEPVSLRDLPATVVDLTRLNSGSPFPGRSLAEYWDEKPRADRSRNSVAISEVDIPLVIGPERGRGPAQRGLTMSLVTTDSLRYIVDVRGVEELYDVAADPRELHNLKDVPEKKAALDRCRVALAEFLRDNRVKAGPAADYQTRLMQLLQGWLPRPSI
jgi:arylsulfatase A-like enzyme